MKAKRVVAVVGLLAVVGFAAWVWWPRDRGRYLSGWVEGDAVFFAAPTAGPLQQLHVSRGERVNVGAPLFAIDPQPTASERAAAEANLEAAEFSAEDTRKGQRPQELAVIEAQRANVRAQLVEAQAEYERVRTLARQGWFSQSRLDQAEAAYRSAQAQVREMERRLDVAELASRPDQIRAAEARTRQARGSLAQVDVRLRQLAPAAPAAGRIEDTFFQPGEWVPANQPVLAMIPDGQVKLRFFVPEAEIAAYKPGREVAFACDGCPSGLRARITYVSPRPEFTPPVIYSRETRDRLVFLVEAHPTAPGGLTVGQPVEVTPLAPGARRR